MFQLLKFRSVQPSVVACWAWVCHVMLSAYFFWGVMLCGVEVKSEQLNLESFAEDGEWFCCPDIGPEFVPPLRCQNRKELGLRWANFVCPQRWGYQSDMSADVDEQSALAGACGLSSVWSYTVPLMALKARSSYCNIYTYIIGYLGNLISFSLVTMLSHSHHELPCMGLEWKYVYDCKEILYLLFVSRGELSNSESSMGEK